MSPSLIMVMAQGRNCGE